MQWCAYVKKCFQVLVFVSQAKEKNLAQSTKSQKAKDKKTSPSADSAGKEPSTKEKSTEEIVEFSSKLSNPEPMLMDVAGGYKLKVTGMKYQEPKLGTEEVGILLR